MKQFNNNWKSAFEDFFQSKELFLKNFYFNKKCENEIEENNEKFAGDKAIQ